MTCGVNCRKQKNAAETAENKYFFLNFNLPPASMAGAFSVIMEKFKKVCKKVLTSALKCSIINNVRR